MFIRSRDNILKNGAKQTSYSLCESRRIKGLPKQKTILNLGRDFPIEKKDWNEVTDRVEARLKKESSSSFEPHAQIDAQVDRIVKELNEKGYDIFAKRDDRHLVSIEEIEDLYSMSVGGERIVLKALSDLDFDKHLKKVGLTLEQIRLAHVLIAARCLAPASDFQIDRWLCDESSLYSLLDLEPNTPSLDSLYRIGEKLYDRKEMLIDGLFYQSQQLFNYTKKIGFYDLTNVYCYDKTHGDLLTYDCSKEEGSDCLLVSLALVLDASGFPCQVELLPGNISEPKTLAKAIKKLGGEKPTILINDSTATKSNLDYLTTKGLKWLCIDRQKKERFSSASTSDQVFSNASETHYRLWDIKRVFQGLTSELSLGPTYHHKIKHIKAHLFISVLVYYAVHLVRIRLKEKGVTYCWNHIAEELSIQRRTIVKLPKNATTYILAGKDMVATEFQKTVYEVMGLEAKSNLRYQVIDTEKEEAMD